MQDSQQNFIDIATRIFEDRKGTIFIGGEEIKPEFLSILRDQAHNLETSQLYEIFLATLKNEASNLALIQSKDWESVQFAKALYHCTFVIENMLSSLKAK